MRFLLQRVSHASVTVAGSVTGIIDKGLLIMIGIHEADTTQYADYLIEKTLHLRVFSDASGRMNLNVLEVNGGLLLVSQFTLYGDTRRGRRPSFDQAAPPAKAKVLYDYIVKEMTKSGLNTQTGVFQSHMDVELVNDGPVTLLLGK